MPLPAVHFALASDALERWSVRPRHAPFDPAAPGARNAFLQGALGPDMGLFPGGEPILSQLAHSQRTGELTRALAHSARTELERAFAWGWLTHVLADAAIHPTVNDCARRIVKAEGGLASDEQAVSAAHSRVELGLELRMYARQPALLRLRLAHAFDARSVAYLGDAFRSTYGLTFKAEWLLRSHRAVAPMARALALLVRLHAHVAPHRARPVRRGLLCALSAAFGRRLAAGTRAFLQPVPPPRPLLRAYRDAAAEFWGVLRRLQLDGLRSLGEPDMEGKKLPLPLSA